MVILTPKGNKAEVKYTYDGIPTDGLIPLYLGYTVKDRVIIQPHLETDKGLLYHELTHVDQWYNYYWFNIRYRYSKDFRFKMEAEAFAAQLVYSSVQKIDLYANELSNRYNIDKTKEECRQLIFKYYKRGIDENS